MKELTPIDCAVFGSEQMVVNSLEMFLIGEVRIETQSQFKMPLVREEVITDPVVLKIISYLKENIGQKITLADVYEKFKYSQANPYSLYTVSLKALSSGTVSALGIVEPLSATLFGTFLFGEKLTVWSVAGIVLILSSVVLLGKAAVNVGQS